MGLFDLFNTNTVPTISNSILPDAAKNEIMSGRLPKLNTENIFLKKGEYCCYIDKAILMHEKKTKAFRHMGVSSPGLLKGNRITFGGGDIDEFRETEKIKAIIYVTNQRIILQCKEHGFDKSYKYLSAIKAYTNGVGLQYGNKTYNIIVPDGIVLYRTIKLIQQRRSGY